MGFGYRKFGKKNNASKEIWTRFGVKSKISANNLFDPKVLIIKNYDKYLQKKRYFNHKCTDGIRELTIWQKKYASKKSGVVLALNLENISKYSRN